MVLIILLLPRTSASPDAGDFLLLDVTLAALCVLAIPSLIDGLRTGSVRAGAASGFFLVTWTMLAYAHLSDPAPYGVATLLRLLGVFVLAVVVSRLDNPRARELITGALVAAAAMQAFLVIAQVVHGGPVGLVGTGERQGGFYLVGSSLAPRGTFSHPYILASFCLLAAMSALVPIVRANGRRKVLWLSAGVLAAVPVGMTFSRMALIGLVSAATVLAVAQRRGRPGLVTPLLVVFAGAALAGFVCREGWEARARATVTRDIDALTSRRVTMARESVTMARQDPVVGAGPGRLAADRVERAHAVPLLIAVEGGLAAGVAAAGLLVVVGVRATRGGALTAAAYLSYLPFVLLDRFPYDTGQGLTLTALWIGLSTSSSAKGESPGESGQGSALRARPSRWRAIRRGPAGELRGSHDPIADTARGDFPRPTRSTR